MRQRPYVLVNMAMTADGKIDTVARRGARISGAADSARVDRLRADADAVLVGGRTLLGEDPRLTVRDERLVAGRREARRSAQPAKVAVVSSIGTPNGPGSLPRDSRFLGEGGGRVIVVTTVRTGPDAIAWLRDRGAEVIVHHGERVDLRSALASMSELGIERLMVEGGSTLVAALLGDRLVDEFQLAIAARMFGGENAPSPVGGAGWAAPGIELRLTEVSRSSDDDVVLRYLVEADTATSTS